MTAPTPITQAKDLLSLIATPSALATGTLLTLANAAIKKNQTRVEPRRMRKALLAAVGALGISGTLVGLMAPLATRSLFVYRGSVEAALVIYWIIFISIIGGAYYSAMVVLRCIKELGRPSD